MTMEPLIKISLSDELLCDEESRKTLITFYSGLVNLSKEKGLWDDSIKSIEITDELEKRVKEQASIWGIKFHISREKEYRVVSKILFNQKLDKPQHHIYVSFQSFFEEKLPHNRILLGQIIPIYAKNIIPIEIQKKDVENNPLSLNDYLISAVIEWCVADFTRKRLNELISEPYEPFKHNTFLIAFKRKLKKYLYEYNNDQFDSDSRLKIFWINYFSSIRTLFLRLAETNYENNDIQLSKDESSYSLIYSVLSEINLLTESLIAKTKYNLTPLKEAVKRFSAHFEVFLENEKDDSFYVRLTKDPKDYFNDEIVETEPRFVCFIDILGFSDLINEYDSDITSTVLQDLQESFSLAKTSLIDKNISQFRDTLKHLKYQTFSDNICISIPYFENQTDFISNFNLLTT